MGSTASLFILDEAQVALRFAEQLLDWAAEFEGNASVAITSGDLKWLEGSGGSRPIGSPIVRGAWMTIHTRALNRVVVDDKVRGDLLAAGALRDRDFDPPYSTLSRCYTEVFRSVQYVALPRKGKRRTKSVGLSDAGPRFLVVAYELDQTSGQAGGLNPNEAEHWCKAVSEAVAVQFTSPDASPQRRVFHFPYGGAGIIHFYRETADPAPVLHWIQSALRAPGIAGLNRLGQRVRWMLVRRGMSADDSPAEVWLSSVDGFNIGITQELWDMLPADQKGKWVSRRDRSNPELLEIRDRNEFEAWSAHQASRLYQGLIASIQQDFDDNPKLRKALEKGLGSPKDVESHTLIDTFFPTTLTESLAKLRAWLEKNPTAFQTNVDRESFKAILLKLVELGTTAGWVDRARLDAETKNFIAIGATADDVVTEILAAALSGRKADLVHDSPSSRPRGKRAMRSEKVSSLEDLKTEILYKCRIKPVDNSREARTRALREAESIMKVAGSQQNNPFYIRLDPATYQELMEAAKTDTECDWNVLKFFVRSLGDHQEDVGVGLLDPGGVAKSLTQILQLLTDGAPQPPAAEELDLGALIAQIVYDHPRFLTLATAPTPAEFRQCLSSLTQDATDGSGKQVTLSPDAKTFRPDPLWLAWFQETHAPFIQQATALLAEFGFYDSATRHEASNSSKNPAPQA